MSFEEKVKTDGLGAAINMELDNIKPEYLSFLHNFVSAVANITPFLTQSATVAETLTGNAALAPLTEAIGQAVSTAAQTAASHNDLATQVQALANATAAIASQTGNAQVASDAGKVSEAVQAISANAANIVNATH